MLVVAVPEAAGPWWTHDRDDSSEYRVPVPIQPRALLVHANVVLAAP
jgi:hypothetical protein